MGVPKVGALQIPCQSSTRFGLTIALPICGNRHMVRLIIMCTGRLKDDATTDSCYYLDPEV